MFKHLGATELLAEHEGYSNLKLFPPKDLKLVIPTENLEEQNKVEQCLQDNYDFLKAKRVEKVSHLTIAEWLPEENMALVTNQVSKIWSTIGQQMDKRLLIDPFEIVYLMESNQLELLYNNVSMSIEQSIALVTKLKKNFLDQYKVYAQLRRYGYVVMQHNPKRNIKIRTDQKLSNKNLDSTMNNCLNEKSEDKFSEEKHFSTNSVIKNINVDVPTSEKSITKWQKFKDDLKRKSHANKLESDTLFVKKPKFKETDCSNNSTPLLDGKQFISIEAVYSKLQVIQKENRTCEGKHDVANIKFTFDLFKPRSGFKKSALFSPDFRIIVLNTTDDMMPCERCLTRKKLLLQDDVQILIARSGFDNISYFLYNALTF